MCLQSWLASSGDDGRVSIYDTSRPSQDCADRLPSQLVLQHIGHLGNIIDAQWSPTDPFLMMSVSNDGHTYKEGGACQVWRLSWLLTCELSEAEKHLKDYQKWLETGKLTDLHNVVQVMTSSQPGSQEQFAFASDQGAAPDTSPAVLAPAATPAQAPASAPPAVAADPGAGAAAAPAATQPPVAAAAAAPAAGQADVQADVAGVAGPAAPTGDGGAEPADGAEDGATAMDGIVESQQS